MRDIVIVGGGLVGLCAALALQHGGRRLAIIEAGRLEVGSPSGLGSRSIALSYSSLQIFRALGLWPQIKNHAAPIRHIHVSARGRWGVTRLHAHDHKLDALGYVIEHDALLGCLLEAVAECDNIELIQQACFESIVEGDGVEVAYSQDDQQFRIPAGLAIVADGAHSKARQALGIDHHQVDYGQTVVISNIEVSKPQADTAFERFAPQGPLAMLPLGAKSYACVWTLDPETAATTSAADDAAFSAALQKCFGYRLGVIERVGQRFTAPIQRTSAKSLHAGRCLLIGNAANALHPVAGQSFNLSLRDIACIYELLAQQQPGQDEADVLAGLGAGYESQRRQEHARVIGYGDALVTLFSNELPLFGQVRAAGLGLLDLLPALKTQAALSGMGMSFGGNRLLRGHR